MKINFPSQLTEIKGSNGTAADHGVKKTTFSDYLNSALSEVNSMQMEAQQLNEAFAMGSTDNLHQVMIAAEKADIALQLTIQLRNKVLEAYQEIMRMPV